MKFILTVLLVLLGMSSIATKTKEEWKTRSIYQILTDRFARTSDSDTSPCDLGKYCGGTYQGILNHLDYIQDMGFNAIWISPIVENTEGSYHGYSFTNLYKLNENFGGEESFKKFVEECHKRDIWIMVDVVANHCGIVNEDYSRITPFNKPEHYHPECQIVDWNDQWNVENCRLLNLPDLKQENDWVTTKLCEWIQMMVKQYNIDGIRVDTVPEVPKWFWEKFRDAAGVYQLGEVFNGNPDYVGGYQGPLDALFNYPLHFNMKNGFCNNLREIENYYFNTRGRFKDPTVFGVFLENHDNSRFLHECGDRKKFKNAIAFGLLWEGIPVFYYGGEQWFNGGADPQNREPMWGNYRKDAELYQMISKINKLRHQRNLWKESTVQRYADENFYAFTRGDVLVCTSTGKTITRVIAYHEWAENTKFCDLLNPSDCVFVRDGKIFINLDKDPKVYVKQ